MMLYETSYQTGNMAIHHLPSNNTWSKKEKELRALLFKVNPQSIIGYAIRKTLSGGSLGTFRKLIKELNEQSMVARKELIKVVGFEAVELINDLTDS